MKDLINAFHKNICNNEKEYFELYQQSGYISNSSGSSKEAYKEISFYIEGMSLRMLSDKYRKMICTPDIREESLQNLFNILNKYDKSVNLIPNVPKKALNNASSGHLKEIYFGIEKIFKKYGIEHTTNVLEINMSKSIYNNIDCAAIIKKDTDIYFSSIYYINKKRRAFIQSLSSNPFDVIVANLEKDILNYLTLDKYNDISPGKYNTILAAGTTSILFHECCGHLFEASKTKSPFYSFSKNDILSSNKLTVVDDVFHLGNKELYDDEGNKKSKTYLIKEGKFENLLADNYTSYTSDRFKPTGNCRRESYLNFPEPRMYCTYVENGYDPIEKIFGSVDNGIFIKSLGEAYVNHGSGDFESIVQEGYLIKNGKIKEPIYGIKIMENAGNFLKNIQYISDDLEIVPSMCHSNSGSVFVEYGSPTIFVKDVNFKY